MEKLKHLKYHLIGMHGLHKSIDEPPLNYSHKYSWQKDHKPNMTGTKDAHFPPSNPLSKRL